MNKSLPILTGPILSVGEEPHDFQIHFDAIKSHFGPVDPFEVRQVELIAYCDLDIDRNRRRMQSYMERAIDEYAHEIAPMFNADPPIDPKFTMTRAATCAYVDNRDAVMVYEQNIRLAENRRRQLIADLEHYQRQRRLKAVEDAEEVQLWPPNCKSRPTAPTRARALAPRRERAGAGPPRTASGTV